MGGGGGGAGLREQAAGGRLRWCGQQDRCQGAGGAQREGQKEKDQGPREEDQGQQEEKDPHRGGSLGARGPAERTEGEPQGLRPQGRTGRSSLALLLCMPVNRGNQGESAKSRLASPLRRRRRMPPLSLAGFSIPWPSGVEVSRRAWDCLCVHARAHALRCSSFVARATYEGGRATWRLLILRSLGT